MIFRSGWYQGRKSKWVIINKKVSIYFLFLPKVAISKMSLGNPIKIQKIAWLLYLTLNIRYILNKLLPATSLLHSVVHELEYRLELVVPARKTSGYARHVQPLPRNFQLALIAAQVLQSLRNSGQLLLSLIFLMLLVTAFREEFVFKNIKFVCFI